MPVALGTFLQTGDDDLSTHEAGAASGTGRNVQLGSKIVLQKHLLYMSERSAVKKIKNTPNDSSVYSK